MMKPFLAASVAALSLCACTPASKTGTATTLATASASASTPSISGVPAGTYTTDKPHTSLTFEVSHMGFSHYTAHFTTIDATLKIDPAHPDQATLSATIDPQSLALNAPPKGFHDELMGKVWFEAAQFPKITFVSTKVELTGPNMAKVTGDFTLHGVTRPVVMDVTFNGGYPGMMGMDPNARIGFSATGVIKRSDFGISFGIPAPGSNMGVGDEVAFQIETEMTGPALAAKKG